jgi:CRP/FNR family transcriptional regulator, cyclic AMP receptor protein
VSDLQVIETTLQKVSLFKGLAAGAYTDVAQKARRVAFNAGQSIFSRGDKGDDIFIVLKGRVRISVLSLDGRELSFSHAGAPEVFGEIAAFDGGIRTADATAITAVDTLVLNQAIVSRLIANSPAFAQNAIGVLCKKLRDADLQLENVALHAIEVRLARYLLAVLNQQYPGDTKDAAKLIKLDMSQAELALLIGASRPKVNAALALLEGDGAITRRGDNIECSISRLKHIAAVG